MAKLVMNLNNEQNIKALVEWCKQYHIEYQLLADTNIPQLVDDRVSDSGVQKVDSKKSDDNFISLGKGERISLSCVVYKDYKAVRHYEFDHPLPKKDGKSSKERMDAVKYAIAKNLKEAGAVWDNEKKAYIFKTKKALEEWVKAQKNSAK